MLAALSCEGGEARFGFAMTEAGGGTKLCFAVVVDTAVIAALLLRRIGEAMPARAGKGKGWATAPLWG